MNLEDPTAAPEHERYRLLAAAAVDGRIPPDEAIDLERHLAGCPRCRADAAAMQDDHAWLAAPMRVASAPGHIRDAVLDAARSPTVPRLQPTRPWSALAAAALVVAFLGGSALLALRDRAPGVGGDPTDLATEMPSRPTGSSPTGPIADGCAAIPAGLTARWTFDSPVEHLSGEPIAFTGEFVYAEGVAAGALRLAGGENAASVPSPPGLEFGTGDFTISLWVKYASTAGEQVLVERFKQQPLEGWSLTKLATGRIRLAVATDQGELDVDASATVTPGPWHHVAVRRAGLTFSVVVDGAEAAVRNVGPGVRVDLDTELPLLFGRRGDARVLALDGDLDEVLAWTGRALADEEIGELRRAGDAGFCEAAAGAGYEGTWAAMDCATQDVIVECDRWGDQETVRLVIGPGEAPVAQYEDDSVAGCGAGRGDGPRRASGTGEFDGIYLWVAFDEVDCAASSESWANPMQLYRGPGDPAIWFDPDGDDWGLVYRPG